MKIADSPIYTFFMDLLPSCSFLLLELILIIRTISSSNPPSEEENPDESPKKKETDELITISSYVQYKLSLLLAFIYVLDVIYSLFFSPNDWWIKKESYFIYYYFIAIISWLISSIQIKWISHTDSFFFVNLRIFWIFSFLMHFAQFFLKKSELFLFLLIKVLCSFVLLIYALKKEEKSIKSKSPRSFFFSFLDNVLFKFEENFYIRVIFLGRNYERFLRKEIELSEFEVNSTLNTNLSYSEIKKKEKVFVKKLNEKNYLNELEEQEFLTYLPSIQILIWKEPVNELPFSLKNYDPRLFFVVYSYLTWDLDNRLEFKIYRKLSEFLELEKKLNDFYKENSYFNRQFAEFQRFSLEECERDEDLLYKKRALTIERFFNFVLLREKALINPLILEFLEINPEEKKPFLAYFNFLIKTRIIRRRASRAARSFNQLNTLESPLLTENFDEVDQSQSSCSIIPMNYLLLEVRLINIWKFPNEPLESNITMAINEKNINYDWEITKKFIDFVNLHSALKTKPFKDQQDFVINSQKIAPLLQIKANTYNYFFNFEIIKKDMIDYITFLVTNSQFHCNELFNFIEFDPNAMKRFLLGKNFNKFLAPTQTVRTFTNESHAGGKHQHMSVLSFLEPAGTEQNFDGFNIGRNPNNLSNPNIPILKGIKRAATGQKPGIFIRSSTERKNEGNLFERFEDLRLQNFFANVGEIRHLSEGKMSFVISLNEYFEETLNKVKRRVIFEKNNRDIRKLYQNVVEFCESYQIDMSLPLRNIEILEEENEEDVKNGVEIYLNEVIKLPNITKKKEVLSFFSFEKIRNFFEENKEQEIMVLDLREK